MIKNQLRTATCLLLVGSSSHAVEPIVVGEWDVSAALLVYSEPDRVNAVEPIINARRYLDTDESINLKLTVDTLTGASASGALPSLQVQTFTRPSGSGNYQTSASSTPLDDTFHDTRVALAGTWSRPGSFGLISDLGVNVSKEYDYQSFGISTTLYKNLNKANTTLSAGLSLAADEVEPVGGKPLPFGIMQPEDQIQPRTKGNTNKTLVDFLVGVTQIINANSLMQFNYSISVADGYLNDPYKVLSVVEADSGRPLFENELDPNLPVVVFENRPDSRVKNSLFGLYKRHMGDSGDVMDTSYRFMFDDWGINSHTVDFRYRKQLRNGRFLQPHIRLYQQNAADFYHPFYIDGDQPVVGESEIFGSADYRLGEFSAYTVGLEYGHVKNRSAWTVALEYYLQSGNEPANKFGEMNQLELFPDVEAVILRVEYDF